MLERPLKIAFVATTQKQILTKLALIKNNE